MKTTQFYRLLIILAIALTTTSCVQDGDFNVPNLVFEEPEIITNSSLLAIKTALQQEFNASGNAIYTFFENEENPTYLEAYVVSTDATGNFYKKLFVQDKIENPTAGLEIVLNKTSLNETYEVGRKIYIKLDGLSVSYDDGQRDVNPIDLVAGKYVLGVLAGARVDDIPSTSIKEHLFRSTIIEEITPTIIQLKNIKESHIGTLIQLPTAQMIKSDLTKTFAGEPNDEFDGFRTVLECVSENTIKLQTSTFSSFKSNVVPQGKGAFTAVLSKDFRSEFLVAIINTPSDINFLETDRCDPPVLECESFSNIGSVLLLNENFNTLTGAAALANAGWTNVNVSGGNTVFSSRSFSGDRYMQIGAFRTGENPLEAWLVSPAIDLETTTNEVVSFDTNTGFDNGKALSVFVSSNFSGDVATATWVRLDAILSEGPSNGYNSFVNSGAINISCLSGNIHIAFKYEGADGGITTTFQVDNLKVTGL